MRSKQPGCGKETDVTTEQVQAVFEAAWEHELTVDDYGAYSGRGMFGKETFAVTVPDLATRDDLIATTGLTFRTDQLGKDYILY